MREFKEKGTSNDIDSCELTKADKLAIVNKLANDDELVDGYELVDADELVDVMCGVEQEPDEIDDEFDDDSTDKKSVLKSKKQKITDALKSVEERSLYVDVDRFLKKKCSNEDIQKMVSIINNEGIISLRLVNWFAMKFSANMKTMDYVDDRSEVKLFDVKISYHARLDTHSKKYFDPFRRGPKFDYNYDANDKTKVVETALCQLNFFRWLFMHNLMKYIEKNLDYLKSQMGSYNIQEKKKKEKRKKEKENTQQEIIAKKKEHVNIKVKRTELNGVSTLVLRL